MFRVAERSTILSDSGTPLHGSIIQVDREPVALEWEQHEPSQEIQKLNTQGAIPNNWIFVPCGLAQYCHVHRFKRTVSRAPLGLDYACAFSNKLHNKDALHFCRRPRMNELAHCRRELLPQIVVALPVRGVGYVDGYFVNGALHCVFTEDGR